MKLFERMNQLPFGRAAFFPFTAANGIALALLLFTGCFPPAQAADGAISKWGRFEQKFESGADYQNPLQEAALTATFTSPKGGKFKVPGFWDGRKTWRVRFSPGEEGKWSWETACSDANNKGLHQQSGSFSVSAAKGGQRFAQHGPVRVAEDGRYFAHADDTAFFWMADTGWNGALLSTDAEWDQYIAERARQKFTAVQFVTTQWRAAPTGDRDSQPAYTGKEKIVINPKFFQRLDGKIDALNQAGLLAAPVLLWAIGAGSDPNVNPGHSLPEDQAILLARYQVARWGGNQVAWLLAGDGDYRGPKAEKWHRIGRAVFNDITHAPVTMHPGGMQWVWKEFIGEKWYNFVAYQSGHGDDDKTMRWLQDGPMTEDWTKMPHKPFVNLEPPYENHLGYQSKKPHTQESVRRAIYWSLLDTPTAGVTYGGHGVWGWDDGSKPPADHAGTGTPMPWQKALTMPGAEQMKHLADFFNSFDFWRLRPAPVAVVNQPGAQAPAKYIAAAKSDQKDLLILYIPEERSVEVKLNLMPNSPNVTWINPRTGEKSPAVAVVTTDTCQFPTPAEGDWILFMKTQTEEKGKGEPEKK
jgi:hypothetical protein